MTHSTEDILNEIGWVLVMKFRVTPEEVQESRDEICRFAKLATPGETLDAVQTDPTDNRMLECSVAAGWQAIVSGDRHLLQFGEFRGIRSQEPAPFLCEGSRR